MTTDPPRFLRARRDQPGAVVLVLDGDETLEVAPESLPPELPPVGETVPPALVDSLRRAAERKRAARRLLQLLDRKLQPVARLRNKLECEGFAAATVTEVLGQMERRGLHSDRQFAEAWCRDTLRARSVGRRYLEARLREKGVPPEVAGDVAAAALSDDEQRDRGRREARRRWRREKDAGPRAEARVARYLAGRGFPPGLSRELARVERPGGDGS